MHRRLILLFWFIVVLTQCLFSQAKLQAGRYHTFDIFEFSLDKKTGVFDPKPHYVLRRFDDHGGYNFFMKTKLAHEQFFVRNYQDTMIIMTLRGKGYTDKVIWKKNRTYITHIKTWARMPSRPTVLFYFRNDTCLSIEVSACNMHDKCFSEISPENIKKYPGYKLHGTMRFEIVNNKLKYKFCGVDWFLFPNCNEIKFHSDGNSFEDSLFLYLVTFPRRKTGDRIFH